MAKRSRSAREVFAHINQVRSRYMLARAEGMSVADASAIANGCATEVKQEERHAVDTARDDLTRITGVGAGTARKLNEIGVLTFEQIASWSEDEAKAIDASLSLKGSVIRNKWVEQAKELMS